MSKQDEKSPQSGKSPVTGAHIAPKGHGAGCPCCMPPEEHDEDDD